MRKLIIQILIYFITIQTYLMSDEISRENSLKTRISNINFIKDIEIFNLDGSINAVIEIPSGSILKRKVNEQGNKIELSIKDGKFKQLNYLGYPANYGFIPKTLLPYQLNGDGDTVDVLVLGRQFKVGQIIRCKLIGMLEIKDQKLIDNKVICIDFKSELIKANNLDDLKKIAPGALEIIEIWFKNYKGEILEIIKYSNKKKTINFINDANSNFKNKN